MSPVSLRAFRSHPSPESDSSAKGIAEIRIMNAFGVKGRNDSGYFTTLHRQLGHSANTR